MADRAFSHLHPAMQKLARKFLDNCAAAPELKGCKVFIDQSYRNKIDQNADYAQGRTAPGKIITNAQYGQSPHNHTFPDGTPAALAFDFAIQAPDGKLDWDAGDERWRCAISVGTALGLVSGSIFHHLVDSPHLELAHWANIMPACAP